MFFSLRHLVSKSILPSDLSGVWMIGNKFQFIKNDENESEGELVIKSRKLTEIEYQKFIIPQSHIFLSGTYFFSENGFSYRKLEDSIQIHLNENENYNNNKTFVLHDISLNKKSAYYKHLLRKEGFHRKNNFHQTSPMFIEDKHGELYLDLFHSKVQSCALEFILKWV